MKKVKLALVASLSLCLSISHAHSNTTGECTGSNPDNKVVWCHSSVENKLYTSVGEAWGVAFLSDGNLRSANVGTGGRDLRVSWLLEGRPITPGGPKSEDRWAMITPNVTDNSAACRRTPDKDGAASNCATFVNQPGN
jgi:hypothetical protein